METIFHLVDLRSESISVGCNIFRQFICRPKVNDIPSYYGNFRIIDYNKFICKIVVKYLFNAFNALYLIINALYLLYLIIRLQFFIRSVAHGCPLRF